MTNILDLTLDRLRETLQNDFGQPRFRADQVWQWLWQKLARDFASMSNVSLRTRELLAEHFCITYPKIYNVQISSDRTTKFLLELEDGARIETVLIPSDDLEGKTRISQCVSTQVGCPMQCTFCATGSLGFERNLSMGEILGQILVAREYLNDLHPERPIIRNIVFMGMGEPLLNLDTLLDALRSLNDPHGMAFSPRRLTVSTCGIPGALVRLGESHLCYLAVSLHAPNQAIREQIMPRAARWSFRDLMACLKTYPLKNREYITFEYLLLRGINDSREHAEELARVVSQVKGKLNLIAYNRTSHAPYEPPSEATILAFEEVLWKHRITAIRRASKGDDIDAACGQLKASQM